MRRSLILISILTVGFALSCADFFGDGRSPRQTSNNPAGGSSSTSEINAPNVGEPVVVVKTIAKLRNPNEEGYEAPCANAQNCAKYSLKKVVVTTETFVIDRDETTKTPYLFGFFVADPDATDQDGRLMPFSGLQVAIAPGAKALTTQGYTFGRMDGAFAEPAKVNYEGFPRPGDVINIDGESKMYFGMPQLGKITLIEKVEVAADFKRPLPAQFDANLATTSERYPGSLKGGHPAATINGTAIEDSKPAPNAQSWVGALVELRNVDLIKTCAPAPYPFKSPTQLRDYGYFQVTGDVEVGTLFGSIFGGYWKSIPEAGQQTCENRANKCEDSRQDSQHFDSIVGVVDYSYGVYRVNPRHKSDIQPQSLFASPKSGKCD